MRKVLSSEEMSFRKEVVKYWKSHSIAETLTKYGDVKQANLYKWRDAIKMGRYDNEKESKPLSGFSEKMNRYYGKLKKKEDELRAKEVVLLKSELHTDQTALIAELSAENNKLLGNLKKLDNENNVLVGLISRFARNGQTETIGHA